MFFKGDKVKIANKDGWSNGGEVFIGKTGTIENYGFCGSLATFTVKFDEPHHDKFGIWESTLAHENNLERL